jgi:hypothetical protein
MALIEAIKAWLRGPEPPPTPPDEPRDPDADLHAELDSITAGLRSGRDRLVRYCQATAMRVREHEEAIAALAAKRDAHASAMGTADTLAHNIGKLLTEKL